MFPIAAHSDGKMYAGLLTCETAVYYLLRATEEPLQ